MPGRSRDEEQRIIDHEVRLSRARESVAQCHDRQQRWSDRRAATAEQDWYREEVVSILAAATTEQELQSLGLSNRVIREVGLGESLLKAWRSVHPRNPGSPRRTIRRGERPSGDVAPRPRRIPRPERGPGRAATTRLT